MAAALVDKSKTVTIIGPSEVPFQHALGKQVGTAVQKVLVYSVQK